MLATGLRVGNANGGQACSYASFSPARRVSAVFSRPALLGRIAVSLSEDQVRNVAHLARLGLDDDQIAEYAGELSNILDVVASLEKADTTDVEPMAHPLDLAARLRADEAVEVTTRDAFQAIAPAVTDGVYRVPKVIE